jgi:hypothetical protein
MESLLNDFTITLRFKIMVNATYEQMSLWNTLKTHCELRKNPLVLKEIVHSFRELCNTDSVKHMDYLEISEGGLLLGDKQIRFRNTRLSTPDTRDNEVVLEQLTDSPENVWTLVELSDIVHGFEKYANNFVKGVCITGSINLIPKTVDNQEVALLTDPLTDMLRLV